LNDAGQMIEKWYFELENKFPDIQGDEYVVMPNHFHAIIINVGADLGVRPENQRGGRNVGADLGVRPENQQGEPIVGADLGVRPENQRGGRNVGADLRVRPHNQWGEDKEGRHIGLPLQKNGGSFETVNDGNRGEGEEGRHAGLPLPKNGGWFKTPNGTDRGGRNMGENTGSPVPEIVQWFKTMTTNDYMVGVKNKGWRPFNKRLWQRNYWEHIIRDENELDLFREYMFNNPLQWALDDENPNKLWGR